MPVAIFIFVFAAAALATWAIDALPKKFSSGEQAPNNRIPGVDQAEILAGHAAHHRVPDYVSPIVAYRMWHWDGAELKSLNGEVWRPNQPLAAKCRPGCGMAGHGHKAPHDGCTCGIYATKSPDPVLTGWWLGVYGEVYLWGTVVEHELGWRAQFAYPKRLVLSFWGPLLRPAVRGDLITGNAKRWLAPLTAYGADIYLADEKGDILLWTARSGCNTDELKRLREAATLSRKRLRRGGLQKPAIRHLVRKLAAHRKRPPGPPPPPPAVPVHSPADLIRIIQSRRDGWPAHWSPAADCDTREVCHG